MISRVAVSMNLLGLIMLYIPNVATTYRTMFLICSVAITNSVASHVYRKTKFGDFKDSSMIAAINRNTTLSFVRPRRSRDARRDTGTPIPSQMMVITTTEVALDNLSHSRGESQGSESLDEEPSGGGRR